MPNIAQTESGHFPPGNGFGPFLFGGYDINNKLPYTENWTFDVQYQASNSWLFSAGYVGNHGLHQVLPIPFNQAQIATPQHPINGQIYSYGGATPLELNLEPVFTNEFSGNAPIRVPYIGYDMNSVLYKAEGISNYNALQLQVRKRLSMGLQLTASYTWSHALDEQSGLGLFFTGNNPLTPKSSYASADFDQTHVFLINYSYRLPKVTSNKAAGYFLNDWIIGGQTVAQSGQPYSIYDYSGSVASQYLGTSDYIGNPIVPLKPGVTASQAQLQGTTGVNAGKPVLNVNDFAPSFLAPGQAGVPPCDSSGCDLFESLYGYTGRNIFRGAVSGALRHDHRQNVPDRRALPLALQLRRIQSLQSSGFRRAQQRRYLLPRVRRAALLPAGWKPRYHPAHSRKLALLAVVAAFVVLDAI